MRRHALALAVALTLLSASCASDSDDVSAGDTADATTTTTPPTSTTVDCTDHDHHDESTHGTCTDGVPPVTSHPHQDMPDGVTPGGGGPSGGHHAAVCDPPASAEEQAAADALIAAVEREKPRFATEQQARDAGYIPIAPPFAGHGAHWVNPQLFDDGAIVDPTKPESLIYLRGELEGFMFLMDETDDVGPQPGGCITQWHSHDDLCMTAPIQEGGSVVWLTDFGPCPQGSELIVPPPMLHVWVIENAEGPFAGLET